MKMRRLVCLLLALGLCAAAPSALGSYPDGGFRPEASPGETLRAARISCTEEVLYESMAFPVTLEVAINGDVFCRGAVEAAEAEVKSDFFFPLEGGVSTVYPSLERPESSRVGYLYFHRFVRPVLAPVPMS